MERQGTRLGASVFYGPRLAVMDLSLGFGSKTGQYPIMVRKPQKSPDASLGEVFL